MINVTEKITFFYINVAVEKLDTCIPDGSGFERTNEQNNHINSGNSQYSLASNLDDCICDGSDPDTPIEPYSNCLGNRYGG